MSINNDHYIIELKNKHSLWKNIIDNKLESIIYFYLSNKDCQNSAMTVFLLSLINNVNTNEYFNVEETTQYNENLSFWNESNMSVKKFGFGHIYNDKIGYDDLSYDKIKTTKQKDNTDFYNKIIDTEKSNNQKISFNNSFWRNFENYPSCFKNNNMWNNKNELNHNEKSHKHLDIKNINWKKIKKNS